MLLMTALAYALTNTRERFDKLVLVCVLSVVFYGVRGGIFTLLHGGVDRVYGPPMSMIGDNNDLGVALTMMLPLLFYLRQRYNERYIKWPMLVAIGLTIIGDLFTYSRGALVAMSAMSLVFLLRTRHKVAMAIVVGITACGVLHYAPPEWFGRMETIQTYQKDESAEGRLYYWQLSWAMALKHPLLGAGFHWSFDPVSTNWQLANSGLPPLNRPRAPHSHWFEMLSDHGFPGLAIFIGFFVIAALDAQWLIRRTKVHPELLWANNFGRMLQVAIVGFAVGGSFASLDMYDGFYAVILLGAVARRIVTAELAAAEAAPHAKQAQALNLMPGIPAPARLIGADWR
jgi:probable O-glycosylation ligase (exosortase A-associated)